MTTATEKLLTYALGRPVDYDDMPTVRAIVRRAAAERLPVLVARPRRRRKRAVSDEDEEAVTRAIAQSLIVAASLAVSRSEHMAFITKKHLSRRTFLNGVGVTMALPLLESMVPAATPLAQTAATGRTRLGCIYVPHGATMDKWTPAAEAPASSCRKSSQPLKPFRDRMNIISDLSHPQAYGGGSATSNHNRSAATFLSGAHAEAGPQAHLGITMDQFAAQHIGQDTPLPSLELMIEDATLSCGDGLSCAYRDTISWQSPTSPLPMQNNPQVVFERLFGDGSTDAERRGAPAAVGQPARFGARRSVGAAAQAAGRRPQPRRSVSRRRPRDRAPDPEGRAAGVDRI